MTAAVDSFVADVEALVSCESPSANTDALARCADAIDAIALRRIGMPAERMTTDGGRTHLRWQSGAPRVVLLGHYDTVWPIGTLARWPFAVDGDRMTGPGVFDMKVGVVQAFAALESLGFPDGAAVLLTSDEEVGSTSSRELIEETCGGAAAVLVLEPSADGALKVARKGVGMFRVDITGRAAHAGLDPHSGINATVEAAHQVLAIAQLARDDIGTTVTPTVVSSGTTVNTVPASATVAVDVRAESVAEMERVTDALESLVPSVKGATVSTVATSIRMPFERKMSDALFTRAQRLAGTVGIDALDGVSVGGGSDGNLTAALGIPTLDGLGAVGGNAHAEGEWASLAAVTQRTALVAAVVRELLEETE
ncbi:MAG TPA: M20/M25/M40 family metallo-hydrolase [Mycobacteriales bacterium]|nr:M20/M25/M40 family metallo-hydrolase [Mycobacteriales bacterium]